MKTQNTNRAVGSMTTNVFNAPIGNAYINSTVHTTNNVTITVPILQDIDRISEGNPELQAAALELRNAHAQGTSVVEKFQKWATLAITVGGLAEKIHQYYPHIAALISKR